MMSEISNNCVSATKELHSDWEITFYNEDDALRIVQKHFPELENLYGSFPLNVQRADIFRIMVVYLYGGFYMDLDVHCLKQLDPLLKFNLVLGEEKHLKREVCTALGLRNPKCVANYMFGSVPGHPFWLDFLNEVMEKSLIEIKNKNDVFESTGPGLLTYFYHSKANYYKDITLLLNKDRVCLNDSHKEVACHFGNYAAHFHAGTWRWQNGETSKFDDSDQKKKLQVTFKNSFRYKIENKNCCDFNFYEDITGIKTIYNRQLSDVLKKMGNVIENLSDVSDAKVVLYGPISNYIDRILPKNTYIYCNSFSDVGFSSAEVNFINNNFHCCIVPALWIKEQYELYGIVVDIQIIEPGFLRYKRELNGEREIYEFKLGCYAATFDVEFLRKLLQACINLRKDHVPYIKISLYDPAGKFKNLHPEFEQSGVVDYVSIAVGEDFFSAWFKDLALGFLGCSDEPCPCDVLEFIYMGIPVIIPDMDNYKHVLKKINANPAVILSSLDNELDLHENNVTIEAIEKAILHLYQEYDYYSANAADASEELEDMQTTDETEHKIISLVSKY